MRGLEKNYMKMGTDIYTSRYIHIATTRKNRPKGGFFEKKGSQRLNVLVKYTSAIHDSNSGKYLNFKTLLVFAWSSGCVTNVPVNV